MESMLNRFDLFVFDWDGTIIRLYNHVRLYGRIISAITNGNKGAPFYDSEFEPPEELKSEENYIQSLFLNFFVEHMSKPHLNRYVLDNLELLKKKKKKIGVLTNGNKNRVLKKMQKIGIEKYFDIIVSTKDLHAAKPNPAGLKLILKALGAKPGRSIYIGDKVDDILTARYAKISSCGIADGFDSLKKLESAKPDYVFRSMEEFYRAL